MSGMTDLMMDGMNDRQNGWVDGITEYTMDGWMDEMIDGMMITVIWGCLHKRFRLVLQLLFLICLWSY